MHRLDAFTLLLLGAFAAPASLSAQGQSLDVSGPKTVLTRVPFTLSFTVPESGEPVEWAVFRAQDGEVLATGASPSGADVDGAPGRHAGSSGHGCGSRTAGSRESHEDLAGVLSRRCKRGTGRSTTWSNKACQSDI